VFNLAATRPRPTYRRRSGHRRPSASRRSRGRHQLGGDRFTAKAPTANLADPPELTVPSALATPSAGAAAAGKDPPPPAVGCAAQPVVIAVPVAVTRPPITG
jgi:hypothetical protein